VVCVWSDECPESLRSFIAEGQSVAFDGTVHHTGDLGVTMDAIKEIGMVSEVIVGSEPGVCLADALAHFFDVRGNGLTLSATRRNKYAQSEAIRSAGLSVGHQALVSTSDEVEAFLAAHCEPFTQLVVKPISGAASEGVTICRSADEVRASFASLHNSTNVFGHANLEVLLMEYLGGDEYVVDTVSRNGMHKCVALWKYEKRACNGVSNCWFAQRLLAIDAEPQLPRFVQYIFGVLDAIGIKNGAVHSELKYDGSTAVGAARGPVLIESNCRLHGLEGSWCPITEACFGYSQVGALLDAYYAPEAFGALPTTVPPAKAVKAHGAQVGVRSMVEGTIARVHEDRFAEIRAVESYAGENLPWSQLVAGKAIARTVDVVTLYGQVNLVHASETQLEADAARVRAIIDAGLFEVEDHQGEGGGCVCM